MEKNIYHTVNRRKSENGYP